MALKSILSGGITRKRAWLSHTELFAAPGSGTHDQIGAGKQDVEAVQILCNTAIHGLAVTELPLDNQKWMLDLAPG